MENLKTEKDQLADLERLRQQKKYDEFFTTAEKAITDYPDSYPLKFLYAAVLVEMQRLDDAESVLKDLMITFPDNINLLLELGKVTFALFKHTEAAEYYNKILFLDPFNALAKAGLEKIKSIQSGQPAAAPLEPPPPTQQAVPPAPPPTPREAAPPAPPVQQPGAVSPGMDFEIPPVPQQPEPVPPDMDFEIPPAPQTPSSVQQPGQAPDMDFEIPPVPQQPGQAPDMDFEIPSAPAAVPPAPPPPAQQAVPPAPPVQQPGAAKQDFDFEIPPAPPQAAPPPPGQETPGMDFEIPPAPQQPEPAPPDMDFEIPAPPPAAPPPPGQETPGMDFEVPPVRQPGAAKQDFDFEIPPAPQAPPQAVESPDEEFEIPDVPSVPPGLDAAAPPPPPGLEPAPPPGLDAAPAPPPGLETASPPPPPGLETAPLSPAPTAEAPGAESDMDFEIPSVSDTEDLQVEYESPVQEQPVALEGTPPVGPAAPQPKEFDIPPVPGADRLARAKPGQVEDTMLEIDAPDVPQIEQGPAIPPPSAASPEADEYDLPSGREFDRDFGQDFDQESLDIDYEAPVQEQPVALESSPPLGVEAMAEEFDIPGAPGAQAGEEFDIPAEPTASAGGEFEIPSAPAAQGDEFEIPSAPVGSPGEEFDIPAEPGMSADDEFEIPEMPSGGMFDEVQPDEAAETVMQAKPSGAPQVEQGPPIAPPDAVPPVMDTEFEIPAEPQAGQGEFGEIPEQEPVQESYGERYEIPLYPAQEQAPEPSAAASPVGDTEFEIPAAPKAGQGVPGEMPAQEPGQEIYGDRYEMPLEPVQEQAPGQAPVPPGEMPPASDTEFEIPSAPTAGQPGGNEEEFMTESAAELYISQGLFDDAEAIYRKLYQAKQDEKYLHKIRQISIKKVKDKKVQALNRFLEIIEKKGEKVV